jgi:hypothetical protein
MLADFPLALLINTVAGTVTRGTHLVRRPGVR